MVAASSKQTPELERRGERSPMQYRRFGRTHKALSVITLGGMRYHEGWTPPRDELPARTIEQCRDTVQRAFALGINHIETAHGYGKSEHLYGKVLNEELKVPRDSYFFMTKGAPETGDETKRMLEEQLRTLGMNHFDLYAWHGMNNQAKFSKALAKGGPVEVLKRYQEQGDRQRGLQYARAVPRDLRCDFDGPLRLREFALLLFFPAKLRRRATGRRPRHGRVHHFAQ
jgi:hypothetical protein